jgi:hypothetical protein
MATARRRIDTTLWAWLSGLVFAAFVSGAVCAQDAASLRARHAALHEQFANNQFQRSLYLESSQTDGTLKGETFSVVDVPHGLALQALKGANPWCEILMLHLLVKNCVVTKAGSQAIIGLDATRTWDQAVDAAHHIDFHYKPIASSADYLQIQLNAETGPMGTKNYRLMLESTSLDAKSSFIHMSYSYGYGFAARLAMEGYLATLGRNKVGFTITGHTSDGKPVYMGNVRGVVERNTMRYYLAIEAYLGSISTPTSEQTEKRMRDWYAGIERYPVQLHEMERSAYLDMKRKEIQRQQAGAKP